MSLPTELNFPLADLMDFELAAAGAGWNRFEVIVTERHLNPNQVAHGGVAFVLGDTGMGLALVSLLREGEQCASIDCRIDFQRAVMAGERLTANSKVIRRGRRVAFCESEIWSGEGHLVSRLNATFSIHERDEASQLDSSTLPRLPVARALTIAGSDSSGGAGIQADLKTFEAFRVFGMSAVTAITAQNTRGVTAVEPVSPEMVAAQIGAVASDLGVDGAKTGMLVDSPIIASVAEAIGRHLQGCHLVVDPVMVAKSGARLLAAEAVATLKRELLPLAGLVTPNLPEAEVLLELDPGSLRSEVDRTEAGKQLLDLGPQAVLMKGGHAEGDTIVDLLVTADGTQRFLTRRVPGRHTHGTGCTASAAIAALRARGVELPAAVKRAQAYLRGALQRAPGLGGGHGPLGHAPG